jgi:hypothetical protein
MSFRIFTSATQGGGTHVQMLVRNLEGTHPATTRQDDPLRFFELGTWEETPGQTMQLTKLGTIGPVRTDGPFDEGASE